MGRTAVGAPPVLPQTGTVAAAGVAPARALTATDRPNVCAVNPTMRMANMVTMRSGALLAANMNFLECSLRAVYTFRSG